jgi:hypothetical protein
MYRADVFLSLAPETSVRTGARHRHSTGAARAQHVPTSRDRQNRDKDNGGLDIT